MFMNNQVGFVCPDIHSQWVAVVMIRVWAGVTFEYVIPFCGRFLLLSKSGLVCIQTTD